MLLPQSWGSTELLALMVPFSAGLGDELQRQICFMLLRSLQVRLCREWCVPAWCVPAHHLGMGLSQSRGWSLPVCCGAPSSYFLGERMNKRTLPRRGLLVGKCWVNSWVISCPTPPSAHPGRQRGLPTAARSSKSQEQGVTGPSVALKGAFQDKPQLIQLVDIPRKA